MGTEDGKKYWKWYGFDESCDWCACFVSWCIAGDRTLDEEEKPRFSYCQDGAEWFIRRKRWAPRNAQPLPGMIIFFDGNGNGTADHVGIVKSAQNGKIETIEGDSGDRCEENLYDADCETVMGYGILGRDTGY